jgi:hypothetical protein
MSVLLFVNNWDVEFEDIDISFDVKKYEFLGVKLGLVLMSVSFGN